MTGRPRGVLHITPRQLQGRFDSVMREMEERKLDDFFVGILASAIDRVRGVPPSYLGGEAHYPLPPDSDLGVLGGQVVDLLDRRTEIRDHLGALITRDRGLEAFDGRRLPGVLGRKHEP